MGQFTKHKLANELELTDLDCQNDQARTLGRISAISWPLIGWVVSTYFLKKNSDCIDLEHWDALMIIEYYCK